LDALSADLRLLGARAPQQTPEPSAEHTGVTEPEREGRNEPLEKREIEDADNEEV
jgi:hypothetical protein